MMAIINEKEFEITDGILHHKENVDLLPANIELSALEVTMGNVMKMCIRDRYKNWNDEEMMRHRYAIPFMIWANYDIGGQKVEQTSMNYLQTLLMETTGSELTGFQKYQQDLQKEIPVLTGNGYIGADGKFYELNDETSPYYSLLQDYSILQYNDLVDTKNRDNDFFNLQK